MALARRASRTSTRRPRARARLRRARQPGLRASRRGGSIAMPVGLGRHQVVGVEEPVVPSVDGDGVVGEGLGPVDHRLHIGDGDVARIAREAVVVERLSVGGARLAERVHDLLPLGVRERTVGKGLEPFEGICDGLDEVGYLDGQRHGFGRSIRQQIAEDLQVAAEREERNHRDAVAHEGVVGVVPLRALGVHPDAALGDEVGQLRQQRDEQLLGERDEADGRRPHPRAASRLLRRPPRVARWRARAHRSKTTVSCGSRRRSA